MSVATMAFAVWMSSTREVELLIDLGEGEEANLGSVFAVAFNF